MIFDPFVGTEREIDCTGVSTPILHFGMAGSHSSFKGISDRGFFQYPLMTLVT